ncbi:MAG: arginine--tRNA ligase [Candidatus Micrarchaeia archaeon]
MKENAFCAAQRQVQELIAKSAESTEKIPVSPAPDNTQADASSPVCFSLAKKEKTDPVKLAEKLCEQINKHIKDNQLVSSCKAEKGYLNFKFSNKFFQQTLLQSQEENFGKNDFGQGKTAIIDFSSPNVGKPLHIGHIRSTILGDSIRKLLDFCGYKTTASNYLCEAGMQVAKLMLAVKEFGEKKIKDEKDLLEYYVKINEKIEADEKLKQKANEIVEKMENGDKSTTKLLEKVRNMSLKPIRKNYEVLNVEFDEECFDSTLVETSKKIVQEALDKKIAFKDEKEEVVADLENHSKLSNLIILRSNNTTLYSTRDLALADYRWKKHKFDLNIYVTASEQNTHFRQVFKILELLGRPYVEKCRHLGFGLIFLEGGKKLSTRKGSVLLLEDVLNEAKQKAKEEIKRKGEYSQQETEHIAQTVGQGSLKFAVLRVGAEKNIHFSTKQAVSFEGDTGAYLQYTLVRAQNILNKAERTDTQKNNYALDDAEQKIVKTIAQFPLIIENACKNRSPQQLCDYLLKLASQFSAFYASHPVLQAKNQQQFQRLKIVRATKNVLSNGLGLLGIQKPEKM